MNGAELIVSALENEGVQQIFGIPGEENLDVVEALRRSTIELVLPRHEQAAAFMAATHGRLTGRAGVCLTTLGPGALNLTTGAAYALLGAMPMVMITGQMTMDFATSRRRPLRAAPTASGGRSVCGRATSRVHRRPHSQASDRSQALESRTCRPTPSGSRAPTPDPRPRP